MDRELLTVDELAALLKVPRSWIYQRTRARGRDRLPHIKLGKYLRFEEQAVRAWLSQQGCGYSISTVEMRG
jgi:excisionase family DNA binding protein